MQYKIHRNVFKRIVIAGSGDYEIGLVGEGAEVEIVGGWLLQGTEELKVKLTIIHRAPHTKAKTLLKAVVGGTARADIRGKIVVEKAAQQTESFLREAILLVSVGAEATAIPDLEILANEVKCSHAAAISRIDEQQLYYLTSRGLNRKTAQDLIIEGWLKETKKITI